MTRIAGGRGDRAGQPRASDCGACRACCAKADIGLVADVLGPGDWYAGPGDDGAVLPDGERPGRRRR